MLQYSDLQSVTLFDVCFNKHIVCFVWTWRWFTSFCFLQELLWRSLIHAFVSLHRQEPKKKKSTCIKWIPWFNYLYYMYENYYYLDTEFASSWWWCQLTWLTSRCCWTCLFPLNSSDSINISYIAPQPPEIGTSNFSLIKGLSTLSLVQIGGGNCCLQFKMLCKQVCRCFLCVGGCFLQIPEAQDSMGTCRVLGACICSSEKMLKNDQVSTNWKKHWWTKNNSFISVRYKWMIISLIYCPYWILRTTRVSV